MTPRADNAETAEFFSCPNAITEALLWLQSALDCKEWKWSTEQRQMAESALRAAQKDVAELTERRAI